MQLFIKTKIILLEIIRLDWFFLAMQYSFPIIPWQLANSLMKMHFECHVFCTHTQESNIGMIVSALYQCFKTYSIPAGVPSQLTVVTGSNKSTFLMIYNFESPFICLHQDILGAVLQNGNICWYGGKLLLILWTDSFKWFKFGA